MNPMTEAPTLLHDDLIEIKDALAKIGQSIEQLSIQGDHHAQATQCLNRAIGALDRVERRVDLLEQDASAAKITRTQNSVWIDRALLVLTGAVVTAILKHLGVL